MFHCGPHYFTISSQGVIKAPDRSGKVSEINDLSELRFLEVNEFSHIQLFSSYELPLTSSRRSSEGGQAAQCGEQSCTATGMLQFKLQCETLTSDRTQAKEHGRRQGAAVEEGASAPGEPKIRFGRPASHAHANLRAAPRRPSSRPPRRQGGPHRRAGRRERAAARR